MKGNIYEYYQWNQKGSKFPFCNLKALKHGEVRDSLKTKQKFGDVYLETRSGNIYRITELTDTSGNSLRDKKGNLEPRFAIENAKLSKGGKNYTMVTEEEMKKLTAEIGKPFVYGGGANTTEITKIVSVRTDKYGTEDLPKLTEKDNITDKFIKMRKS